MPTPANRTPLRVARGTYSNLNSSVADIQEGEVCYATDQNKLYVKEGSALVSTQAAAVDLSGYAQDSDIGSSIQAFDADTAKTDTAQTFTAAQRGDITELSGTSFTLDLNASNNFKLSPSGTFNVTLSNLAAAAEGQTGSIFIVYAGTESGSFPTTMKFVGGATGITLTSTAGAVDRIDYIVMNSTTVTCNVTANYVA